MTREHQPRGEVRLHEVFGVDEGVKEHSYVDRGKIDEHLRYALNTQRHIAIHGASKQGKTWLRSRVLSTGSIVLVQCQPGTTIASLFTDVLGDLNVRAELRYTSGTDFEGTLDFDADASVGVHWLGRVGVKLKSGIKRRRSRTTESQLVGQTPANIHWVARTILASKKRLVIEDCHYLVGDCMRDLSFILKALGGYGVYVMIAGIWAENDRLTYYNGNLVGRVEDIHVTWSDDDLNEVLRKGCQALNIEMSTSLRRHLIEDAAGNVGLLQRLAEMICREEKILVRQNPAKYLTPGPSLNRARHAVASGMQERYQSFADNFDGAVRRACPSAIEPNALLRALIALSDEELLQGVDNDSLAKSMAADGDQPTDPAILTKLLEGLSEAQASMSIRPPVLAYNQHARKVYITDRSLYFFRRYGSPRWPW